jgi:acyl-CoA reductase-like NAD-dependent aldehyde dehydrogenase
MSPPYTQFPIFTPVEQFRKPCINKINNQRCRRKARCTKSDVRKAEHAALLRELAFSGHKLSQEDRAAKIRRFAELSVCSMCNAEVGEISKVTDEQMQAFIEILFPDGVEQIEEMDDDDSMGMFGEDDDGQ